MPKIYVKNIIRTLSEQLGRVIMLHKNRLIGWPILKEYGDASALMLTLIESANAHKGERGITQIQIRSKKMLSSVNTAAAHLAS